MEDLSYLLALHLVDGLGSARLKKLLDFYKSAKDIWDKSSLSDFKSLSIPEAVYYKFKEQKKSLDPEDYLLSLTKKGIKILTFFDEDYPKDLKEIYDPPLILYYKGEILKEDDFALGVVGTRKVTGYGVAVTEKLVSGLVEAGFTIVSGLARGVDTLA